MTNPLITNPLMTKIKLPGRIFQLPSRGLFLEEGVLADHVRNAEIQVQPLSALSEMKLRSPDLLFSGRALREVCLECIPDILKPERLISKDVDAIFCFLRVATYGSNMRVKSTHDCKKAELHEYEVDIENIIMNPNNKPLDHIDLIYSATLSNGQVVKLRPVRFQDSIDMVHMKQEIESKAEESGQVDEALLENAVVSDLMAVIEDVDGIVDRAQIEQWVRSLPRKFFIEIVDAAKKSNEWGFNLTTELTCKDCGVNFPHNLELDPINFFSG